MSVSVSISNTRALNREIILLVASGGVSGLVAAGLELLAGQPHPELSVLSFGAVVGLAANLTDSKEGTPMLRLVLALLGGAAMAILMSLNPIAAAAVGGGLIGGALTVGEGYAGMEKAGVWLVHAIGLAIAMFVTGVLATQFFSAAVMVNLFQGAVWGLFMAFAGGLARLNWSRDEVLSQFREAEADLKGSSEENMRNGRQLYEQILAELDRAQQAENRERAKEIAIETARALIALARRADELRVASEVKLRRHLPSRVVELDERIKAEKDATVRKELQATLDELIEQVRVRNRLQVARARLEARQQRCFTAMERLHVALIQGGSGEHADSALEESMNSLEKLSEEIRWRNLSVDELCEGAEVESDEELVADMMAETEREESEPSEDGDESNDAEEVQFDTEAPEEEVETGTVLDTESLSDEPKTASTDGTDGTVGETVEEAHVESAHSS